MIKKYINQKGIGLVEVIAALAITLVTITSLVSLALFSMRTSLQSKLTLEGSKMASREMELVRAYRDRSATWADFSTGLTSNGCSGAGVMCHMLVDTVQPASNMIEETVDNQVVSRGFNATIDPNGTGDSDVVYVTVTVSWEIAGRTHTTHLYTYLTNWR